MLKGEFHRIKNDIRSNVSEAERGAECHKFVQVTHISLVPSGAVDSTNSPDVADSFSPLDGDFVTNKRSCRFDLTCSCYGVGILFNQKYGRPMILFGNLPRLCEEAKRHGRVLDVGGWFRPFNLATHVIDIQPYDTRQTFHSLDPENSERFSSETWCQIDACKDPWPYPDNYFDFSVCSHTLEDLPDPISVCCQLNRVSKAGYIEVPSRRREIFTKQRFASLRARLGFKLEIGFPHHHWICDLENDILTFQRKDEALLLRTRAYLTRIDIGRKLTEQESGLCIWWQNQFQYQENQS